MRGALRVGIRHHLRWRRRFHAEQCLARIFHHLVSTIPDAKARAAAAVKTLAWASSICASAIASELSSLAASVYTPDTAIEGAQRRVVRRLRRHAQRHCSGIGSQAGLQIVVRAHHLQGGGIAHLGEAVAGRRDLGLRRGNAGVAPSSIVQRDALDVTECCRRVCSQSTRGRHRY